MSARPLFRFLLVSLIWLLVMLLVVVALMASDITVIGSGADMMVSVPDSFLDLLSLVPCMGVVLVGCVGVLLTYSLLRKRA